MNKPPAPPKSSSETFLASQPNNKELGGYFTALAGALTFVAKVLNDDLKAKITGSIDSSFKPLAADVAAMKNDLAVLPGIGTDISSIKTSTAIFANNVEALGILLFAVLVIALYLMNEETKKMSEELAGYNKKKR